MFINYKSQTTNVYHHFDESDWVTDEDELHHGDDEGQQQHQHGHLQLW